MWHSGASRAERRVPLSPVAACRAQVPSSLPTRPRSFESTLAPVLGCRSAPSRQPPRHWQRQPRAVRDGLLRAMPAAAVTPGRGRGLLARDLDAQPASEPEWPGQQKGATVTCQWLPLRPVIGVTFGLPRSIKMPPQTLALWLRTISLKLRPPNYFGLDSPRTLA